MKTISDIKHAFYINLVSRPDRKEYVENQLKIIGIKAERFNAIKLENGAIGCSLSHLKCLQTALNNNWDHVFICEDDITFLNPDLFIKQFNCFLENVTEWDVVLFGGNLIPPYKKINDSCVKVTKCQTTTGYLVNKYYIPILINNIKTGVNLLMKNPEKHLLYAIDRFWFYLQEKDNWFLITPLTVVQNPGYSDIEKKNTNYQNVMTDMNKYYLFR
jgi:GR25 family glycosyltransferase involved in LPS biosynthesis